MSRITRQDYFMAIAQLTALRGTCNRLQVGCVLVNDNRIASVGYNSSVKGTAHCIDVGCLMVDGHCKRCPHAEVAAVANLTRRYPQLKAYITHQPCLDCLKLLVTANVTEIYYIKEYQSAERNRVLDEISQAHPNFIMQQIIPITNLLLGSSR
ncbi:MAG TPA: deaminase [Candidatus Nanoarchaeia archaeon]|nr:deaminase [Candidatus Nanoarchaeia archaeon]